MVAEDASARWTLTFHVIVPVKVQRASSSAQGRARRAGSLDSTSPPPSASRSGKMLANVHMSLENARPSCLWTVGQCAGQSRRCESLGARYLRAAAVKCSASSRARERGGQLSSEGDREVSVKRGEQIPQCGNEIDTKMCSGGGGVYPEGISAAASFVCLIAVEGDGENPRGQRARAG